MERRKEPLPSRRHPPSWSERENNLVNDITGNRGREDDSCGQAGLDRSVALLHKYITAEQKERAAHPLQRTPALSYKALKKIWNFSIALPHSPLLAQLQQACANEIFLHPNATAGLTQKLSVALCAASSWFNEKRFDEAGRLLQHAEVLCENSPGDFEPTEDQQHAEGFAPHWHVVWFPTHTLYKPMTRFFLLKALVHINLEQQNELEQLISHVLRHPSASALFDGASAQSSLQTHQGILQPLVQVAIAIIEKSKVHEAPAKDVLEFVMSAPLSTTGDTLRSRSLRGLMWIYLTVEHAPNQAFALFSSNQALLSRLNRHHRLQLRGLALQAASRIPKPMAFCIEQLKAVLDDICQASPSQEPAKGKSDCANDAQSQSAFNPNMAVILNDSLKAMAMHKEADLQSLQEVWALLQPCLRQRQSTDTAAAIAALCSGLLSVRRISPCLTLATELWSAIVPSTHLIAQVWTLFAAFIQEGEYEASLEVCALGSLWKFRERLSPLNWAHWQGVKCWSLVQLGRYDEAHAILKDIIKNTSEIRYQYLLFFINLKLGNFELAQNALQGLWGYPDAAASAASGSKTGFLALAFKDCFEATNKDLAITALKGLLAQPDVSAKVQLCRCLIRLLVYQLALVLPDDFSLKLRDLLSVFNQALEEVKAATDKVVISRDVDWLSRIAWNVGIKAVKEDLTTDAGHFFALSYKFGQQEVAAPSEVGVAVSNTQTDRLRRQYKAALLAAACYMAISDAHRFDSSHAVECAQNAAECLLVFTSLQSTLHSRGSNNNSSSSNGERAAVSLAGAENEISASHRHARQNQQHRDAMLALILSFSVDLTLRKESFTQAVKDAVRRLPDALTCFEILAGVALSHRKSDLAVEVLEYALTALPPSSTAPLEKIGIYRELVRIYRHQHLPARMATLLSEILVQAKKIAPEARQDEVVQDVQWIMIQVWNFGVECFSRDDREYSQTLCKGAMDLLQLLPSDQRTDYSEAMTDHFSKIIARTLSSRSSGSRRAFLS